MYNFSCPDRYLFDPVTRLCQRDYKVDCEAPENVLYYSGLDILVVKLTETDLETFFQQNLRLDKHQSTNYQQSNNFEKSKPIISPAPPPLLYPVVPRYHQHLPWYPTIQNTIPVNLISPVHHRPYSIFV